VATITSTCFLVEGITDDDDAKAALQPLFDIFADHGLGQATFEIVAGEPTRLWVKHKDTVAPSRELIGAALAKAGRYRVVG
jgi:hypothetical protein